LENTRFFSAAGIFLAARHVNGVTGAALYLGKGWTMKHSILQLTLQAVCAVAMGALTLGVQAQYTSPAPSAQTKDTLKAQADANYRAAKSACDERIGEARIKCQRDAQAAYERALSNETDRANPPVTTTPGGAGMGAGGAAGRGSKTN
jgi:hypothetical protein